MSVRGHGGTPRRRPGRALLLALLGAGLATTSAVVACRGPVADDFGAPPVPPFASAASVSVPAAGGGSSASAADGVPVRIVEGLPPKPVAPVRMRIPALDLDAAVDAVGVDPATGDFAVPPGVDRVGWYKFGPGWSATAGSIVVAGHVDAADQGKGAFFRLGTLEAGDEVALTGPGGTARTFEVTARKRYRKTAIPLDDYFARDGEVRLTLITCGGPFDEKTRHYRDNVVVTAVPRA